LFVYQVNNEVFYRTNRGVFIDDMRLNEREDTFVF